MPRKEKVLGPDKEGRPRDDTPVLARVRFESGREE